MHHKGCGAALVHHYGKYPEMEVRVSDDVPPDQVLPCGCLLRCVIAEEGKILKFFPCKETCNNVTMLMFMAKEKGIPVDYQDYP